MGSPCRVPILSVGRKSEKSNPFDEEYEDELMKSKIF